METQETSDQRRERLIEAAELAVVAANGYIVNGSITAAVDAIIESDRAAGCDPEMLRVERDRNQASRQWHRAKRRQAEAERDEARGEIERLKGTVRDLDGVICDIAKELGVEADNEAILIAIDAMKVEHDELTARLAVATGALDRIRGGDPEMDCLEHAAYYIAAIAADALADLPARAVAILRVVELGKTWKAMREAGHLDGIEIGMVEHDLADAIAALDEKVK